MDKVGEIVRSETLEPYESATAYQKGYLTFEPFNLHLHISELGSTGKAIKSKYGILKSM